MSFEGSSIFSSGCHFVRRRETALTILVECSIGIICVKLFRDLDSS